MDQKLKHATSAQPNIAVDTSFFRNQHSAILRYDGAPEEDPIDRNRTNPRELLETDLHPLKEDRRVPGGLYPGGADININMVTGEDPELFQFDSERQWLTASNSFFRIQQCHITIQHQRCALGASKWSVGLMGCVSTSLRADINLGSTSAGITPNAFRSEIPTRTVTSRKRV